MGLGGGGNLGGFGGNMVFEFGSWVLVVIVLVVVLCL